MTRQSSTYTESLMGRRDRYKREGVCAFPGEVSNSATVLPTSRGVGMELEKSAVAIVGPPTRTEGPNLMTRGAVCDCEREGDLGVEFEKIQTYRQRNGRNPWEGQ